MVDWYILDDDHSAILATPDEYVAWTQSGSFEERMVIAKTNAEGIEVSTVFLAPVRLCGDEPPFLFFETMIFASGIEELDERCERYHTWADAEQGHAAAVALVNETISRMMRDRIAAPLQTAARRDGETGMNDFRGDIEEDGESSRGWGDRDAR